MNTYGKFAQEAWRTTAPAEYALIPDPDQWFEVLGEEAAQRVGELMMELAGPDPVGETFLEKWGRLNAAKSAAELRIWTPSASCEPTVTSTEAACASSASSASWVTVPAYGQGSVRAWSSTAEVEVAVTVRQGAAMALAADAATANAAVADA